MAGFGHLLEHPFDPASAVFTRGARIAGLVADASIATIRPGHRPRRQDAGSGGSSARLILPAWSAEPCQTQTGRRRQGMCSARSTGSETSASCVPCGQRRPAHRGHLPDRRDHEAGQLVPLPKPDTSCASGVSAVHRFLRSRSASDTLIRRLDDESFDMFHGDAS